MGSLRDLADGLLATVEDRLGLLAIEVQEEKLRFIRVVLWISASVFTAAMAATFASIAVLCLFWDTARLAALGGLAAFYTVALGAVAWAFRRHLARQPDSFAASRQELREDRACLRPEN